VKDITGDKILEFYFMFKVEPTGTPQFSMCVRKKEIKDTCKHFVWNSKNDGVFQASRLHHITKEGSADQ
jgi:hypothetical protein